MRYILFYLLFLSVHVLFAQNDKPKNIIVFISDGGGYNHILATDYFLKGLSPASPYDSFPVKIAMSTFPATNDRGGTSFYDSHAAWTDFEYVSDGFTESAASATAMSCGYKTINARVGVDINAMPLTNVSEIAKSKGKAVGIITSVPFNHATPASFLVHNISRRNYRAIAWDMLFSSQADVIMGAGSPLHDEDGELKILADYSYIGSEALFQYFYENTDAFNENLTSPNLEGKGSKWSFIFQRSSLNAIPTMDLSPKRVFALAPVASTLSQLRSDTSIVPFDVSVNENIPSLKEMTLAGLNILASDPEGFFLMIEGGAIDWANHANSMPRMIEEYLAFYETVEAVLQFLEENDLTDETMIIVTSDHECGNFWGIDCSDAAFNLPLNQGKGKMPLAEYYSNNHSNQLVPFYAKGPGSDVYLQFADEQDSVRGTFMTNSELALGIKMLWGNTSYVYKPYVAPGASDAIVLYATAPCQTAAFSWYANGKLLKGQNAWKLYITDYKIGTVFECYAACGEKIYKSNQYVKK